ncbi:LCP family protein [Streptomyces formicae]|uniref:Cell envelope-associated transcriptional attenuator LytR-CpsA-Psr n=1 Tax=Streptomyces formicae TaxID=1616117 RepID=A0A291QIT2_9ACTN|nr:LCP family protein [Streptomyces formicae]ATL31437.1 Cell envelope-associated transcriptional attenuator LytR-CpsA-Psr [Streptomyces formicae]
MTTGRQETPARRRRKAPPSRHGKKRRRRLRLVLGIALSLLVLALAGGGWIYLRLSGNIETFGAEGLAKNRPDAASSKGENVLVIGSDARTGGNSALGGGDKEDIGRSDTAFLLHVYADHRHAVAVSIPRDTLVTIPSCRLPDGSWTPERPDTMFNAAYSVGQTAKGNPACTQNTVEKLTGLRVDHTVVIDFKGFAALTDVVGGVDVCLPKDVYQGNLNPNRTTRGKKLFSKGEQSVSGQKALDYVRIRHGIGDGSDIGRIKRQQAFVSSLLKKVKDEGFTPTKLFPLAEAATESMTVDPGLGSADKLLSFAMSLKDIDLHNTRFITIPWRYEGQRVAVVQPDADALWASLKDDRTLDGTDAGGAHKEAGAKKRKPALGDGIRVAVQNGTTTDGLAARAAKTLTKHDFTVTATTDAASREHTTTEIQYGPGAGQKGRAEALATLFPGAELKPASDLTPDAGLRLVLGSSYRGEAPSDLTKDTRSAADNPCSDLSYG